MPKISVLMPVYKVEKYLRQCLDSVVKQTLQDIEIIIVDEGEQDECRKIIDEYESNDSRIITIHEKNDSYGVALNKAIQKATGEYIGIIETDDFINITMFDDLYNLAKQFNADVVKSDWYNYYTNKNKSFKAGQIPIHKINKITNIKQDISLLKIPPSIWSAIYKRDFIIDNNISFIDKLNHSYQDTSFKFKTFALADRIVLTNKAYVNYRVDNEDSSCNTDGKIYAICYEYEEITKFLNNHKELKEIINTRKLINEYSAYIWNLKRINQDFRQEFINKISQIFNSYNKNNEINEEFFKKINHREFELLLNNPKKYKSLIDKKIFFANLRNFRKKLITVRFNRSRTYICIFGKTVLEVD